MTTEVMERPILFKDNMSTAILDGIKTQTRRLLDDKPDRFGDVGDRLWVREIWRTSVVSDHTKPSMLFDGADRIWYRTNGYWAERDGTTIDNNLMGKTRPSIFMPRWASRILLEITGKRVERLHDISEEDAKGEGVRFPWIGNVGWISDNPPPKGAPYSFVTGYKMLWESINGPNSWARNPKVRVISFKRIDPS